MTIYGAICLISVFIGEQLLGDLTWLCVNTSTQPERVVMETACCCQENTKKVLFFFGPFRRFSEGSTVGSSCRSYGYVREAK